MTSENLKTAVFFPGAGLGDMICSLPTLDFMLDLLPDFEIDVCNTGNTDNYRAIIGPERAARLRSINSAETKEQYHVWFECHEFVRCLFSPQILEANKGLMAFYEMHQKRRAFLNRMDEVFPAGGNQMARLAAYRGLNRITLPQWCIGIDKPTYPVIVPDAMVPLNVVSPYITINDGWTDSCQGARPTKALSPDRWADLVRRCRENGITVVQLGSGKLGKNYDVDSQLRGKTTFAESLSILKHSLCHVDIEGGLVHAATAMGTPCVVMHGPTDAKFFSYPQNTNLTTGNCPPCWHMHPSWTTDCLRGDFACMQHKPKDIFRAVRDILMRKP